MTFAFILMALLALGGALATISLRNAVHAALALVATLLSVAILYFTLSAQFLGIIQIIVYAGAIMVLFLFVIMLLNAAQPITQADPIPWVRALGVSGGVAIAAALVVLAVKFQDPRPLAAAEPALRGGLPGPIGEVLFTRFLLPFEAVSVLLLVAVVGAVALVQRDPSVDLEETSPGPLPEPVMPPEPLPGRPPARTRVKGGA